MFLLVACFWNSEALSSFQTYIKRQISQFFWPNLQSSQTISPSHTHIHTGTQRLAYSMLLVVYCISRDFSDARGRNEGTEWRQPRCVIMRLCMHMCCFFLFLFFFPHLTVCPCVVTSVTPTWKLVICEWGCLRRGAMRCTHLWQRGLLVSSYMPSNPLCMRERMRSHAHGPSIRCQSGSSPHPFISMTEELSCQSS